jgi:hypothetical protein
MIGIDEAVLNITYADTNGDLKDGVPFDSTDADIKRYATEAVRSGSVQGISAQEADFSDYTVVRFSAKDDLPNRVVLRPKTPFGGQLDG